MDRNQTMRTVPSMVRNKRLAIGSAELVEYFLSRETDEYAQIVFGELRKGTIW